MEESQTDDKSERWVTHKNQRDVRPLVAPLNVARTILGRLPLVDGVQA